ncbi:c-type cytochrome [Aquabacterium sp.]|uniref:c-type cytochrome n=1 Tax=Aquabacterium sp. TaxID=1872578 RepID=UPI002E36EA30|nr:c-type cytochrome [Aquabacterium sp.]HEX5312394.1 c-type cytochrome [Aquabacterium sp.]
MNRLFQRKYLLSAALISALTLAGCAIEWQNRQPAQEMAELAKPPGSVYTGWRVFQGKCASCHGASATGQGTAPDLLVRLREMGPRQFMSVVLKRYDWGMPTARVNGDSATLDQLVEAILKRQAGALTMPAWEDEPEVNAQIADLYAYLSARSEGTQGPGRPAR